MARLWNGADLHVELDVAAPVVLDVADGFFDIERPGCPAGSNIEGGSVLLSQEDWPWGWFYTNQADVLPLDFVKLDGGTRAVP
jgi:hypothetical protein